VVNCRIDRVDWHDAYADPDSSLSRRLAVVTRRIGEVLDAARSGPLRILSLCAGEGRDLLPELAARPELAVHAVLVELDPRLAAVAEQTARTMRGVEVRRGDAADPAQFADVLPVDLLLLCGIFGNISPEDIRATVAAVPRMLVAGGTAMWTRGRFTGEDLRPLIRQWFVDEGCTEVAFDSDPGSFGVGVARLDTPRPAPLADRLFTFIR